MNSDSKFTKFNRRLKSLEGEREPFMDWWDSLSTYLFGHRGRFLAPDSTQGDGAQKSRDRFKKQLNNKGLIARRVLSAGMMAGITSPARPWFRLSTGDPDLDDQMEVKKWLYESSKVLYRIFSMSNFYNSLQPYYSELGTFGTAALGIFEDDEDVIRCTTYTAGQYMIGTDGDDRVDTFYREYKNTVGQIVKKFGKENCPERIVRQYEAGELDGWHTVIHAIEVNDGRNVGSPFARDAKYRSVYYLKNSERVDPFLRKSGFKSFPIMATRWENAPGDIYSTSSPGMTALGDVQILQIGEKHMYRAVERVSDPSLRAPSSLRQYLRNDKTPAPGSITFTGSGNDSIEELIKGYRPDINAMMALNDRAEKRVSNAFYEDLFLMLGNSDRRQITAREVVEKHEEKLLQLGPVLERVHNELLDPAISRTFEIAQRGGYLPEPPEALMNIDLRVEYISVLAQAQRLVGLEGIERVTAFAGQMMALDPSARHKVNTSRAISEYADTVGIDPAILKSDEEAAGMARAEAEAAQQQQMGENMQLAASTAKDASQADITTDNALTSVMRKAGLA